MNIEKLLNRARTAVPILLLAALLIFVIVAVLSSPDLADTISDAINQWLPDPKIKITKNLKYANGTAEQQHYLCGDFYSPSSSPSGPVPVVVIVHGGSWNSGDKSDVQESASSRWFAKHGYAAFDINYRLSGHGGEFPQDILDMKEAVLFLQKDHEHLNINPNRIFMLGSSSGATGVMMAAYWNAPHKNTGRLPVKAIASFSGPTDLSVETKNYYVNDYFGKPNDEKKLLEKSKEGSPLFNCKEAIPTIFIHGTADLNVSINHSISMCKQLQTKGVQCQLVPVEGAGHFIGSASKNLALEKVLAFFNSIGNEANSGK